MDTDEKENNVVIDSNKKEQKEKKSLLGILSLIKSRLSNRTKKNNGLLRKISMSIERNALIENQDDSNNTIIKDKKQLIDIINDIDCLQGNIQKKYYISKKWRPQTHKKKRIIINKKEIINCIALKLYLKENNLDENLVLENLLNSNVQLNSTLKKSKLSKIVEETDENESIIKGGKSKKSRKTKTLKNK